MEASSRVSAASPDYSVSSKSDLLKDVRSMKNLFDTILRSLDSTSSAATDSREGAITQLKSDKYSSYSIVATMNDKLASFDKDSSPKNIMTLKTEIATEWATFVATLRKG